MDQAKKTLQQRLQELRKDYIREYPGRILEMDAAWAEYREAAEQDKNLELFHRQAHSLKGSGATFGFKNVSTVAGQLDTLLKSLMDERRVPDEQESQQIEILLTSLSEAELSGEADNDSTIAPLDGNQMESNQNLLLAIHNSEERQAIMNQLEHYGYHVNNLEQICDLNAAVERIMPFAMIIDTDFNNEEDAGINACIDCNENATGCPPTIFISSKDDIKTRINSVRAGGASFQARPLNFSDIADILESLHQKATDEPFRVMIIEDTKSLAKFFEVTLQSAGMETCTLNEPYTALEHLVDFNPELILMDMYMPGCDGMELAAVIRQFEAYVSIPIVFLSSELDTEKQMEAMRHGGDDFLTKPIDPRHLVSSVQNRASRYRKLRSFMVRDSLTGLYNHTKTKELLEKDLYRTKRNNSSLVFAMLDIDKFKSVNDNFGHPVGDKVIKSLSCLLRQRLRKSDTIGRYGGEEFAVILYDTDITNAKKVMEKILKDFSEIVHKAGEIEFNVTFSCGLAEFPYFDTPAELNEAADKALYRAKEGGRNQVVIADPLLD